MAQPRSNGRRRQTEPASSVRDKESSNRRSVSLPSPATADKQSSASWRKLLVSLNVAQAITRFRKAHLEPSKRLSPNVPKTWDSIMTIVKSSWLNVLLVFIPVGWALHFINATPIAVFVTTFLAIIPLAGLLAFATEELAIRVGETLGGLLNATLGNAVELIVSIIALAQCKLTVVQSSLVGSILSNLLLVLGMCFFAGGLKYSEQGFLSAPSQINSELLFLSVVGILLPGAFNFAIRSSNASDNNSADDVPTSVLGPDILKMSHGVAVILLFIYICYLIFTLWSHASLMNAKGEDSSEYAPDFYGPKAMMQDAEKRWNGSSLGRRHPFKLHPPAEEVVEEEGAAEVMSSSEPNRERPHQLVSADPSHQENHSAETAVDHHVSGQNDEVQSVASVQEVHMNVPVTTGLLIIVTVLVGVTAEFLVDSIDGVTATGHISEEWVGLILLPIVGNAAEHVTAVTVAVKDKLDLSIGVAVGSSIQIALFVVPFMVVLSWIMGKPLTMLFDPFESVVLFLTVLTVNYTTQDAKSNWLEGMVLMMLYVIVAVSFWFYPGYDASSTLQLGC